MKVLKSGVEMTSKDLHETRGGKICACGCEGGFTSGRLHTSSEGGEGCDCGCTTVIDGVSVFGGTFGSASTYI